MARLSRSGGAVNRKEVEFKDRRNTVARKAKMKTAEKLAIHGGPKAKRTPYRTGKRFGRDELKELAEALEQNTRF